MKNKILKITLVMTVATIGSYGIYQNQLQNSMSEIMLANVEALASDETGGSVNCCDNCKGDFCGVFYPANGSGVGIRMYYE